MQSQPLANSGPEYLLKGFALSFTPGIRRFVFIPLIINLFLMGILITLLISNLNSWIENWLSFLPRWLEWLSYILWPLLAGAILLLCSYFFSSLANWIAAPFNGLLSERLEAKLSQNLLPNASLVQILKDLPRIFKREWQKLAYYLPRALGLLLLSFIPLIGQTLVPALWFLFSAWMLSIQYCDYPFDNHKITFASMKTQLSQQKTTSLSFGALVMFFTMTPILNLFIMPAAVCGATAMWVDKFTHQSNEF